MFVSAFLHWSQYLINHKFVPSVAYGICGKYSVFVSYKVGKTMSHNWYRT